MSKDQTLLCPRCGHYVWTTGSGPWHMAHCRGIEGCNWWGTVGQCEARKQPEEAANE